MINWMLPDLDWYTTEISPSPGDDDDNNDDAGSRV